MLKAKLAPYTLNPFKASLGGGLIGGFPEIGGTILGVPIKMTIVFWDLYWGPPILGKLPLRFRI